MDHSQNQQLEMSSILQAAYRGDASAAQQIFALIQADIRAIARARQHQLLTADSASTRIPVEEACDRITGPLTSKDSRADRRHFLHFLSQTMHHLLTEAANHLATEDAKHLKALQASLSKLCEMSEDDAFIFACQYFLGCDEELLGRVLEIPASRVVQRYGFASAWLAISLEESKP